MIADGKTRVLLFLFTLFRAVLMALPLGPLLSVSSWLGGVVGRFRSREVSVNIAQIQYAKRYLQGKDLDAEPGGTSSNRLAEFDSAEKLSHAVFCHAGQAIVEAMVLPRLAEVLVPGKPPEQVPSMAHVTSTGEEIVYDILREGTGAVALSGHIGCIELLAAYHVRCGVPLSVIGRLPNYRSLAVVLGELRKSYGVQTIWRNDAASARKFLAAIRERRFIAALIDQDTKLENQFSSFLGLSAASPIMPIKLAIKYELPIVTSFIVRTDHLQHHVSTERIPYDSNNPDAAQQVLDVYSRRLGELVCRYPEQWIWWHRRWRRRPGINYRENRSALRSTEEYIEWLNSSPCR